MQPVLLSRTYAFAAFGGRWPDVAFLILALSDKLGGFSLGPAVLGPPAPPIPADIFFQPDLVISHLCSTL